MSPSWEEFINGIVDNAGEFAKTELIDLVKGAKADSEYFIRRQGEKTEKYLEQLANDHINKGQFEGYMTDIRDLTELKALELSVAAKARAQKFAKGIANLILDKFLSLL